MWTAKKKKAAAYDEEQVYERVDFSELRDIAEPLVQLLADAPPFYPGGNFKDIYTLQFIRLGKEVKRILNKRLDFEALFPVVDDGTTISHHTRAHFFVNRNNEVSVLTEDGAHTAGNQEGLPENGTVSTGNNPGSLQYFLPGLFKLNPDYIPDYQPSVAAAHKLLFSAIHLIANGNIVPQIVQLENKQSMIRWIPAMIDEQVRVLIQKLTEILPPNLLHTSYKSRQIEK